jgi:uncharacterized iron-regulated membrane protein
MTGGIDQSELWITAGFLLAGLAGAGAMAWLEHRPRDIMKPRLIPTTPVMFASALVALLALVHLVNLFGIRTGR